MSADERKIYQRCADNLMHRALGEGSEEQNMQYLRTAAALQLAIEINDLAVTIASQGRV